MDNIADNEATAFRISPIGFVRTVENGGCLAILDRFRPGLKDLDQFSHVIVIWWADRNDTEERRNILQMHPPYATDQLTGVFACRSESRPNPLAITVCRIRSVDIAEGIVRVGYMDAHDGTPIIDLKAYYPVCDRVREPKVPEWIAHWPKCVEDAASLKF